MAVRGALLEASRVFPLNLVTRLDPCFIPARQLRPCPPGDGLRFAPPDDAVVIRRAFEPTVRVRQPGRARRRADPEVAEERAARAELGCECHGVCRHGL